MTQFEKSKLEAPTEELMNLIFSDIMFQQAMQVGVTCHHIILSMGDRHCKPHWRQLVQKESSVLPVLGPGTALLHSSPRAMPGSASSCSQAVVVCYGNINIATADLI